MMYLKGDIRVKWLTNKLACMSCYREVEREIESHIGIKTHQQTTVIQNDHGNRCQTTIIWFNKLKDMELSISLWLSFHSFFSMHTNSRSHSHNTMCPNRPAQKNGRAHKFINLHALEMFSRVVIFWLLPRCISRLKHLTFNFWVLRPTFHVIQHKFPYFYIDNKQKKTFYILLWWWREERATRGKTDRIEQLGFALNKKHNGLR